jgi:hypothetical protein
MDTGGSGAPRWWETAVSLGEPGYDIAAAELTMSLLMAHVPLTLLWDLTEAFGPLSAEILAREVAPVPA